jgi:hypothetical protein
VEVAAQLYDNLRDQGEWDYVVVRADVVDSELSDIVVPVDAADPGFLQEVVEMICRDDRVQGAQTATVRGDGHFPPIPHDAHGFITPQEQADGQDEKADVYRFPNSPGFNAWG